MKPLQWHPDARLDVVDAADWYAAQGGLALELAFTDALEKAVGQINRHPGIGSPRHAVLLQIADLRVWPVKGFPQLIFYVEREQRIDVWRVLHAQRDIPAWMGETA